MLVRVDALRVQHQHTRAWPVYLVDQPRRGRAGNSTVAASLAPAPNDQLFFDQFRIGKWPRYLDNVQFDRKPQTLEQFFRSVMPNTGPYDANIISPAGAALQRRESRRPGRRSA